MRGQEHRTDIGEWLVGYFCWVVRKGCLRNWHLFQDVNTERELITRKSSRLRDWRMQRLPGISAAVQGWRLFLNVLDKNKENKDSSSHSKDFGFSMWHYLLQGMCLTFGKDHFGCCFEIECRVNNRCSRRQTLGPC